MYSHHHLNVSSVEAHKKFWVTTLGGKSARIGVPEQEVVEFPNAFVFLEERAPAGGTKGTTVNHVGFNTPNLRATIDKLKAAGYPIVTRAELPARREVKDDIGFTPETNGFIAFVMGPDEMKVEFLEDKSMTESIRLHHLHFASQDIHAMKAWYVNTLNARPGMRGAFEAADLPGLNLSWSPSPTPVVGTRGRVLDHIGFEVENLDRFCEQAELNGLKLDQPYTRIPGLGAVAFITDPWGTAIELTEGLVRIG